MEVGYHLVEICSIRQLLVNLAYTDSAFHFFLSGPWLHRIFHLRYISSHWNTLGWTRNFFHCPWKGCRWIMQPLFLCTESLTAPTEWLVLHKSLRVVLPNILWGGLRLRQGGIPWYGRASVLSYSQRTSPLVFGFTPIPKCCVWTWRFTKFSLCFRSDLLCS